MDVNLGEYIIVGLVVLLGSYFISRLISGILKR